MTGHFIPNIFPKSRKRIVDLVGFKCMCNVKRKHLWDQCVFSSPLQFYLCIRLKSEGGKRSFWSWWTICHHKSHTKNSVTCNLFLCNHDLVILICVRVLFFVHLCYTGSSIYLMWLIEDTHSPIKLHSTTTQTLLAWSLQHYRDAIHPAAYWQSMVVPQNRFWLWLIWAISFLHLDTVFWKWGRTALTHPMSLYWSRLDWNL